MSSSTLCAGNSCLCSGFYLNGTCYNIMLANCLQSADKIYCDLCADLYYDFNGFCSTAIKASDPNCNALSADGSRCTGCNLNYLLNSDFICVTDFQLCSTACTQCPNSNFQLYNGNCYYTDPFCIVYNFTTAVCVLCQEGYSINAISLTCQKTVTCLTKNSNNICTACFTGYQLNSATSQCISLPPNCLAMNIATKTCITCSNLATLSNNICVFSTANCSTYDYYGYCQTCNQGYVQVTRTCLPVAANCLVYGTTDQSTCTVCQSGYHLYSQLCYLNMDGCLTYSSPSGCSACSPSYLLVNNICYYSDPNCIVQDSTGLCNYCQNGFLPFGSKCVYYNPFCLSYTSMTCSQSLSPATVAPLSLQQEQNYNSFILQAAAASQTPLANSIIGGAGQGSCTKNGLILNIPDSGISNSAISSYSLNGNVMACQSPYVLFNGQCVLQTANCQSYNQYGNCQQCNSGYDLFSDNSCSLRSTSTCSQNSGINCIKPASSYVIINGSACYSRNNIGQIGANGTITSCLSGNFLWTSNNICWPLDFNCIQQTVPGTCLQCSTSALSLINGRCVFQKLNCLTYSPYGLCSSCATNYILWTGECRPSNCVSLNSTNGYCTTCATNYQMLLGVCIQKKILNCQVYSGLPCLYCSAGYYLTNNGLCAKMINFCQAANSQTGRCSVCVSGYTLYQ